MESGSKGNKDIGNSDEFDYTIVLDAGFSEPVTETLERGAPKPEADASGIREAIDRLYSEYEEMCLKLPSVLDTDDVYPHSYQWRMGDRYDPAKAAVVKEALSLGKLIMDTEAYERYAEQVKKSGFRPDSWE